jgi:hypothetical protein
MMVSSPLRIHPVRQPLAVAQLSSSQPKTPCDDFIWSGALVRRYILPTLCKVHDSQSARYATCISVGVSRSVHAAVSHLRVKRI